MAPADDHRRGYAADSMSLFTSWVLSGCAAALLAGCTGTGAGHSPDPSPGAAPRPLAWSRSVLPDGTAPSVLAAGPQDSLLVGQDGDPTGQPSPRLFRVTTGSLQEVPVRATSFYGRRAVWGGLTADGQTLYAFGGRSGGAHGNIRWTVWSGRSRLAEDVQTFETFGGPTAGGLSAIAVTRGGDPVLVGSHVGARGSGLDLALWDRVGRRWVRRDSSDTALAADEDGQPSVHGMVRQGRGLLVVGSVTDLGGEKPRTLPAAWTSPAPRGRWTRHVLPGAGQPVAEAYGAACDRRGTCLVTGTDGGRLAGWRITAVGRPRRHTSPGSTSTPRTCSWRARVQRPGPSRSPRRHPVPRAVSSWAASTAGRRRPAHPAPSPAWPLSTAPCGP
jgi:hypothetical protein